ncbi:MAG: hypothetical protein WCG75_00070 [Armatimonadota bacterium]
MRDIIRDLALRSLKNFVGINNDYAAQLKEISELKRLIEERETHWEKRQSELIEDRDKWLSLYDKAQFAADYLMEHAKNDVPSITEQTSWPVKIFDLKPEPNVCYFNPSICKLANGRVFMFVRRNSNRGGQEGTKFSEHNDIVAFEIDPETMEPIGQKRIISLKENHVGEHFEDPRVLAVGNSIWLSVSSFVWRKSYTHQAFFQLDQNLQCTLRIDPVYGKNFMQATVNEGHEKNWLFFPHGGTPHFIYNTHPHTVLQCDGSLSVIQKHETWETNPLWKHGHPRGGSVPVLVDGQYWSFFHSSLPWTLEKRRYHMGVYSFEPQAPFRITSMTSLPLLTGSSKDPWYPLLPLVVFPGGAIYDEKTDLWTVVLGVNDLDCAKLTIPHADVKALVRPVRVKIDEPENKVDEFAVVPAIQQNIELKPKA